MKRKTTKSSYLLKQPVNSVAVTIASVCIVLFLSSFNVIRMQTVTFLSSDDLQITADEYLVTGNQPYILLFHEQGSSRGEFQDIAPRLCKMDYNCLAVDLRNGGSDNFVSNETVKRCREARCSSAASEVKNDIVAAIEYAYRQSNQPVILLGSSANASLSLMVARENDHVRAVVALSPGEYFLPAINIEDTISGMRKPVFATSSLTEFPYVSQLVSGIEKEYITLYEPELGEGGRGTASLSPDNLNQSEYWLAILLFFKDLV